METASVQSDSSANPLKLAVLLSGGGRTLENLADLIVRGELDAEIVTVISSQADAYGLERAKKFDLRASAIVKKQCKSTEEFSDLVWKEIRDVGTQLVVLAGWMNLLPIPNDFDFKVINIHPALLPSFGGNGMYGHHVHEAVLAAGCKVAGCTVHLCDNTYDTGPIIIQRTCEVRDDDTADSLAARVFEQECIAYPQAIRLIRNGSVEIQGRRTRLSESTPDLT